MLEIVVKGLLEVALNSAVHGPAIWGGSGERHGVEAICLSQVLRVRGGDADRKTASRNARSGLLGRGAALVNRFLCTT